MKKLLCTSKCIYADIKTVKGNSPLWASSLRSREVESLQINCKKSGKRLYKYITMCDDYQTTTLFNACKQPQFLIQKPYTNECNICKGKGFVITKIHNQHQLTYEFVRELKTEKNLVCEHIYGLRFNREKCVFCEGKGILKNIKFAIVEK